MSGGGESDLFTHLYTNQEALIQDAHPQMGLGKWHIPADGNRENGIPYIPIDKWHYLPSLFGQLPSPPA